MRRPAWLADSLARLATLMSAPRGGAVRAWTLPARGALLWAVLLAVLMSTQFLFQSFVWRHWPVDEVMLGWLEVARDRTVVALLIAAALVCAGHVAASSSGMRAGLLAAAIVTGATLGELVLTTGGALGSPSDTPSFVGRVLRWCVVAVSMSGMFYLWRRASDLSNAAAAADLRSAQTEREIAQARLQALRSQIEPHFLFNTLATVRRLQHTEPAQGAALLAHFLDYLRLTLPTLYDEHATLGQELNLVRAYLGVIATRMSGRLQLTFDVPIALQACEFPPLALATLVENAVKHGIQPLPDGGTIIVTAQKLGEVLQVTVADTGAGFTGSGGSGIGLANIRARLSTLYGNAGILALSNNRPRGVRARIILPCVPADCAS